MPTGPSLGLAYVYSTAACGTSSRGGPVEPLGEVAGRIVSVTAELGRTVQWSTAEKTARRLLREFAVVEAVYEALREKVRGRGMWGVIASWVRKLIGSVFDLNAIGMRSTWVSTRWRPDLRPSWRGRRDTLPSQAGTSRPKDDKL
ncbi:MAG: hypothetical protein QXK63_04950 [Thermoproteus sp.]